MRRVKPLKLTLTILAILLLIIVYLKFIRTPNAIREDADDEDYPEPTEATEAVHEDNLRVFLLERVEERKEHVREDPKEITEMQYRVSFKQTNKNLQQKLVHLDLKGAPPRLEYLKSLLPLLQNAGATGLLIEYEDMFPYRGTLEPTKAGNSFQENELREFLEATKIYDFEVIPLIQTFGHMEYILKLDEFRSLREVPAYPDTICPSKNKTFDIIKEMIDQVMMFHLQVMDLKWIHIGCDEVYHINKCGECIKKNNSVKQTFVKHVVRMAEYIKDKYAVKTLIWDDMLRGFLPAELEKSGLGNLVEPVVWVYATSITSLVPHRIWYIYTRIFAGIWVASAYKGASGSTKLIPSLKKNYANNLSWLNFAMGYKIPGMSINYNFQGIVLTGWSRYHHFAVLCETLPVSVPSLILNLVLVNTYIEKVTNKDKRATSFKKKMEKEVFQKWLHLLRCHSQKMFGMDPQQVGRGEYLDDVERKMYFCSFRGSRLFGDISNLASLESGAIDFHVNTAFRTNGFLHYNKNHRTVINFQNGNLIEKAYRINERLILTKDVVKKSLSEFFDEYTIKEFEEYKIEPIEIIVNQVLNQTRIASNFSEWKKRPFM